MKTTKKILSLALPVSAALLLSFSCKKDEPKPAPPAPVVPEPAKHKTYIINEGNFGQDNGSVTMYDPETKTADANRYGSQNNGEKLGDTPQSILAFGQSIYVVVNNSSKIVRCDLDLKKQAVITGFTSPRYLAPIPGTTKLLVSDIADPFLRILNTTNNTVEGSVQLTAPAERMLNHENKLYVTSLFRDYLYIVDLATLKLKDSILVGPGAGSLQLDKSNNLWVLATGNYVDKGGKLSKINTTDNSVAQSFAFSPSQYPSRLSISKGKDSLFYLLNGVNLVNTNSPQLPASPLIPTGNSNFYGLGVSTVDGNIYVTDAIDFSQASNVLIYSSKGDSLSSFKAGVIASDFLFN